jgi:hypothetical protein
VDQNGPYVEWKFDKRRRLCILPQQTPQIAEQVSATIPAGWHSSIGFREAGKTEEWAASVVRNYTFSQTAVDRYKNQMIPRAQKAYEMYTNPVSQATALDSIFAWCSCGISSSVPSHYITDVNSIVLRIPPIFMTCFMC